MRDFVILKYFQFSPSLDGKNKNISHKNSSIFQPRSPGSRKKGFCRGWCIGPSSESKTLLTIIPEYAHQTG